MSALDAGPVAIALNGEVVRVGDVVQWLRALWRVTGIEPVQSYTRLWLDPVDDAARRAQEQREGDEPTWALSADVLTAAGPSIAIG